MQKLEIQAPAKINLHLAVFNKRPDGFHNLETIFEKIDLCDQISLTRRKQGIRLNCRNQNLPQGSANLVVQAAQALLSRAKRQLGVQITLSKKIPVAAGLGGGSSDAASVLLGLNKLWGLRLTRQQLLRLGGRLGADVPFFILPAIRAIGRGKGERLAPLSCRVKYWYVLVIPRRISVTTRSMYQALRITLTKRPAGAKIILRALNRGDLTSLNKYSYNSFESVLTKRYKEILQIKKALKSCGAYATLISGSGPCVFGVTKTGKEAKAVRARLRSSSKNWQVIITKTHQTKPRLTER